MSRLSIFISLLGWTLVSGVVIIISFSLGYYGWRAIALCVGLGFVLGIPASIFVARRIKHEDPAWDDTRDRPQPRR